MPLNNQPYIPFYVKDWLTNNKLKMCSLGAHGLMISIMCIMHKEENYGVILLKQKFKQTDKQIKNFASQLARLTSYNLLEIEPLLTELIEEKVLKIEENQLICGRMVRDSELSEKRAAAGSKGGKSTFKTKTKVKDNFAQAKVQANSEYVYESESGIDIENKDIKKVIEKLNELSGSNYKENAKANIKLISARLKEGYTVDDLNEVIELKCFQWLNDGRMNSYLRPSTLFNASKFPEYVAEANRIRNNPDLLRKKETENERKDRELRAFLNS